MIQVSHRFLIRDGRGGGVRIGGRWGAVDSLVLEHEKEYSHLLAVRDIYDGERGCERYDIYLYN